MQKKKSKSVKMFESAGFCCTVVVKLSDDGHEEGKGF